LREILYRRELHRAAASALNMKSMRPNQKKTGHAHRLQRLLYFDGNLLRGRPEIFQVEGDILLHDGGDKLPPLPCTAAI
ncbi:MAG TPA: hypothetical protein PLY40_01165, partial [Bacillota bacterium]|nr:hypothetical protein [Bacillota bacterium]